MTTATITAIRRVSTLTCWLLDHRWHNDDVRNGARPIAYDEPCTRPGCPATRNPKLTVAMDVRLRGGKVTARRLDDILTPRKVADRIHAARFYQLDHPATPNTFYAGMAHAELIARGQA